MKSPNMYPKCPGYGQKKKKKAHYTKNYRKHNLNDKIQEDHSHYWDEYVFGMICHCFKAAVI